MVQIPTEFELMDRTWMVLPLTEARRKRFAKQEGISLKTHLLNGMCCPADNTIYIDPTLPAQTKVHTFMHELCHALVYHLHVELEDEQEERFADDMGALLHQFLKSQKGTFR